MSKIEIDLFKNLVNGLRDILELLTNKNYVEEEAFLKQKINILEGHEHLDVNDIIKLKNSFLNLIFKTDFSKNFSEDLKQDIIFKFANIERNFYYTAGGYEIEIIEDVFRERYYPQNKDLMAVKEHILQEIKMIIDYRSINRQFEKVKNLIDVDIIMISIQNNFEDLILEISGFLKPTMVANDNYTEEEKSVVGEILSLVFDDVMPMFNYNNQLKEPRLYDAQIDDITIKLRSFCDDENSITRKKDIYLISNDFKRLHYSNKIEDTDLENSLSYIEYLPTNMEDTVTFKLDY